MKLHKNALFKAKNALFKAKNVHFNSKNVHFKAKIYVLNLNTYIWRLKIYILRQKSFCEYFLSFAKILQLQNIILNFQELQGRLNPLRGPLWLGLVTLWGHGHGKMMESAWIYFYNYIIKFSKLIGNLNELKVN